MPQYSNLPHHSHEKQPDEFVSVVDKVGHFISRWKLPLLLLVVIAIAGFVGRVIYEKQNEKALQAFNQKFFEVQKIENKEEQLKKLDELCTERKGKAGFVPAMLAKISLLSELGKLDEALVAIKELKTEAPDYLVRSLKVSEAQILWQLQKGDEALVILEQLLDEDKKEQEAKKEEEKNKEKAEDETLKDDKEKEIVPSPDIQILKAKILFEMGKVEEAQKIVDHLSESESVSPDAKEKAVALKILFDLKKK